MKKELSITLVILMFIALAATVSAQTTEREVILIGEVTENLLFLDQDGNRYVIAKTDKGREIIELVGEELEVRGVVREKKGVKQIVVESYLVLE